MGQETAGGQPVSDLFDAGGRTLLARLALREPWATDTTPRYI